MTELILYYLIAVNVLTFIAYGLDKRKARRKRWRIPETTLLGLAVVGGSVGAWIAMHIFHHKTLHNKFRYGIPVIFLLQTALALYLLLY
jgi:uncharacterized membrane protein YsdA (DUF1294 family)